MGVQGVGKLKKMPVGYDETNPACEFLKMKGFCTKEPVNDKIKTCDRVFAHFSKSL